MSDTSPVQASPAVFKNFDLMEEIDLGMSNIDGKIDDGFETALRKNPGKVYGRHAGWGFNSKVWFDGRMFHSEVWRYCVPSETISAPTLQGLMTATNEMYGYD